MVKVAFLHPDLGIGGAERLVVDMALALLSRDHKVTVYTTHHDPAHCFSETTDGTVSVKARFDWLPRSVFGKFFALCAVIRMIFLALYVRLFASADVYVVDQVSTCVPFLRLFSTKKVLFYCHYPDLLLTKRTNLLKRLYRKPLDCLEGWTTSMADKVLVNSEYTRGVVNETFGHISGCEVLYPSLNVSKFESGYEIVCPGILPEDADFVFFSLNRYERKKNVRLAMFALGYVVRHVSVRVHLVIAGGYDERVTENVWYHQELEELADEMGLRDHVTFLRSVPYTTKLFLLRNCTALLYTPSNEHFGIVPVESMYCSTPVIAVNSGGPLETVADRKTGFLCAPTETAFGEAMLNFINDKDLRDKMGSAGRRRVLEMFSFEAFTNRLNSVIMELSFPVS